MNEPFIVGVRFNTISKIYHFDASAIRDVQVGDFVIVATSRGRQLGKIVQTFDTPPIPNEEGWKPIERKATARDLILRQIWKAKEEEVVHHCCLKVRELGLSGIKIATAEYNLDGSRLVIHYNNESDPKTDVNKVKDAMQPFYQGVKLEFRLVGARDIAKALGGMGSCGLDSRCCAKFLTSFNPISVKMAKAQQISLTSMEITGMCGRLRCCMVYEYSNYEAALKTMPKRGKRVFTPRGEGKVITLYPLKGTVLVGFPDNSYQEYNVNEIEPWSEGEAQQREQLKLRQEEQKRNASIEERRMQPIKSTIQPSSKSNIPKENTNRRGKNNRRGRNQKQTRTQNASQNSEPFPKHPRETPKPRT